MAEAANGGRGPRLPEELVVWEILMRLPAKPLLRCRSVCRSWYRRITYDAEFLVAHHRRQPSLRLLTTSDPQERRIDTLDHHTGQRRPVARRDRTAVADRTTVAEDRDHLDVLASCDGLLIILAHSSLYICNPATRERAPLTLLHGATCISGLYPHRPSGTYRVLCCFKRADDGHVVYHVHAIGSGKLRSVGEPPLPWASGDLVEIMPMMEFFYPHVLAGGRLYWYPVKLPDGNGKANNMLVFDTVAESFQHVLSPIESPLLELFQTNSGTLGLYAFSSSNVDLWTLQDHETWAWSLTNRIKMDVVAFSLFPVSDPEGDVLAVSTKGGGMRWQHLQHISGADGSLVARYDWNFSLKLNKRTLKESLIRHDFFWMCNAHGVDENPLFDGLSTVAVLRDDNNGLQCNK